MPLDWLTYGRELQAMAQIGLTYAKDPYDRERYTRLHAIAIDILSQGAHQPAAAIEVAFAADSGYATPKIDVRGVVFRDHRILLTREREDGCWTLPGGWADIGDSPAEAVVREIREETGYEARPVKLLALLDRNKHPHPPILHHAYKLFLLCNVVGGQPTTSHETSGVAFFAEHDLPPLSLTRILPNQIARLFEHHRHPDWPADFD